MSTFIGTGELDPQKYLTKLTQLEKSFTEVQEAIGDSAEEFPNEVTGSMIEKAFKILEDIMPVIENRNDMEAVQIQQFHLKCVKLYRKFIENPDLLLFYDQSTADLKKL